MGLDTSHDCWHGSYSSFARWRESIAKAAGIDLRRMEGFTHEGPISWSSLPPNPLHVLLNHSDCEGEIAAADCAPLADALEAVLPKLGEMDRLDAEQFITGLRRAADAGEPVEFH